MWYSLFALASVMQVSIGVLMWRQDSWMKHNGNVNFSRFMFWKEFRAASRICCLLECHNTFSRGCGYQRKENRCQVYKDWLDTAIWTQEEGMDYYVPSSEWIDLRRYGVSSALLKVTTRMTWLDARSYCENLGGHLYIMDTAQKRQALIDHFGATIPNNYWLGLIDRETEGQWLWLDGGAVTQFWMVGKPDAGTSENCGEFRNYKSFLMNDRRCSVSSRFMCEMALAML